MRPIRHHEIIPIMTLMRITLSTLLFTSLINGESLMGGHLDNQATPHPENTESPLRYRIANVVPFAFNGGQPFSLEKDPVTGQIDFDKAPPLKALNYTGSYNENDEDYEKYDLDEQQEKQDNKESENENVTKNNINSNNEADRDALNLLASLNDEGTDDDQQIPNEINPYSPSFHDFLNLPVRYSNHEKYTNDKYPLISNSYANTKVQGGSNTYNANAINHKNYHHYGGKASTSQSYSMTRRPFVKKITTTKPIMTTTILTTKKPTTTTTTSTTTTTTTTTQRPTTINTKIPTTVRTTTRKMITMKTTQKPTTTEPVSTWKSTKPNRYDSDYIEAMLPIEKMQTFEGTHHERDQIFGISDANSYEDSYEDYMPFDFVSSTNHPSTTTSTSTKLPITTTTPTTTTSTTIATNITTTSSTTTPPLQSAPITSMPLDPVLINSDNTIGMNRPPQGLSNVNVAFNDYSNNPISHPNYSGLVVESASNIIVPPDQDTISFILGNRQNVEGSYYAQGSAIPESPYDNMSPPVRPLESGQHNIDVGDNHHHHPHHHHNHHQSSMDISNNNIPPPMEQNTGHKWWFNSKQSEKSQSVLEKSKDDKINVVAGYRVVFPTTAPETYTPFVDSTTLSSTTLSPSPVLSMMNDGLSQLSEILTPPAIEGAAIRPSSLPVQRPPLNYSPHHNYHKARPEIPTRIQRLPLGPNNNGYQVRPLHMEVNLPNILPQFRPNVKTSQRRGSDAIGTVIVSSSPKYPLRASIRPPLPPPQHRPPQRRPTISHLQRLNPPPLPPPVHTLRLPKPAALIGGADPIDNVPLKHEIPPLRRNVIGIEGQLDERKRSPSSNNQILKSRLNDEDTEKISAESLAIPPRAPLFPKRKIGNSSVTTLQMIQQHRVQPNTMDDAKIIIGDVDNNDEENREQPNRRVDDSPVYIVYPVKGSMDFKLESDDSSEKGPMEESVVIGIRGSQRPLPPDTLPQQSDGEDDEKILPVRAPIRLASDFPYPPAIPNPSLFISQLQEKPLLVPNEHPPHNIEVDPLQDKDSFIINQQDRDTSINVIPYLQDHQPFAMKPNVISTTLQLFNSGSQSPSSSSSSSSPPLSPLASTVTPIAYVYTPTTRAPQRQSIESFERNPVLLPSQQPSSSSSSAPSPQNFMAPFVASISAEAPSKNGWSVVTGGPFISKPNESRDNIDRKDENNAENDHEENNSKDRIDADERKKTSSDDNNNTDSDYNNDNHNNRENIKSDESSDTHISKNEENFDADNFKPQLFGGFQPIFEFPIDNDQLLSDAKKTNSVAMMERPRVAKDSRS